MRLSTEFKQFAMRGNVVDLAIGVVIGAAFGKIVSTLVEGILMPVLGVLIGGIDFSDLAITLKTGAGGTAPVQIKYGLFIQATVDFLIIAFAIFMVIKLINRLQRERDEAPAAAPVSPEVALLTEIRDALRQK